MIRTVFQVGVSYQYGCYRRVRNVISPRAAGEAEAAKWELPNVGEIAQSSSSPARLVFDCVMHESAADQGLRGEGVRVKRGQEKALMREKGSRNFKTGEMSG